MAHKVRALLIFLVSLSSTLLAQNQIDFLAERQMLERSRFVENYEVRQLLRKALTASYTDISVPAQIYPQSGYDRRVQFSVAKTADAYYLRFTNEAYLSDDAAIGRARRRSAQGAGTYEELLSDRFPANSRGTYIFKKDLAEGRFVSVKIYLQSDSETYLRIFPDGPARSRMDVYVFDAPIYRNVHVPLNFTALATSPLARVLSATKSTVNWEYLLPQSGQPEWQTARAMADRVRAGLSSLRDRDDGAQNADGSFVFIDSLMPQPAPGGFNCSGFVKWVADGLYAPRHNGRLMDIRQLKQAPPARLQNNPWGDANSARDPFFGLDWNRNIALAVNSVLYPSKRLSLFSSDVNSAPFAAYTPDIGYPLANLEMILYIEAIRSPGKFYLGSINVDFGSNPILRQHVHTAVFFPYFNDNGEFVLAMFERNAQTNPTGLRRRYPGGYAHLQSIDASTNFQLPPASR